MGATVLGRTKAQMIKAQFTHKSKVHFLIYIFNYTHLKSRCWSVNYAGPSRVVMKDISITVRDQHFSNCIHFLFPDKTNFKMGSSKHFTVGSNIFQLSTIKGWLLTIYTSLWEFYYRGATLYGDFMAWSLVGTMRWWSMISKYFSIIVSKLNILDFSNTFSALKWLDLRKE